MRKKRNTDTITKEIPILGKYQPLNKGAKYKIELNLSEDQIWFVESVAKKYDVSYTAAFHKVWNDAYDLLKAQTHSRKTYTELPAVSPISK